MKAMRYQVQTRMSNGWHVATVEPFVASVQEAIDIASKAATASRSVGFSGNWRVVDETGQRIWPGLGQS